MPTIVDREALAVALGLTPRRVRALIEAGVIEAVGAPRLGRRGRPMKWYDIEECERRLAALARAKGVEAA